MKLRMMVLVLGALACLAADASAAPRPAVGAMSPIAVIEQAGDGQSFFVQVDESKERLSVDDRSVVEPEGPTMHWSPRRGFHADRGCCKTAGAGPSRARISVQRYAGIDPASNRPMYVPGSRN